MLGRAGEIEGGGLAVDIGGGRGVGGVDMVRGWGGGEVGGAKLSKGGTAGEGRDNNDDAERKIAN